MDNRLEYRSFYLTQYSTNIMLIAKKYILRTSRKVLKVTAAHVF